MSPSYLNREIFNIEGKILSGNATNLTGIR